MRDRIAMNLVIFGATGMIGQAVVKEALTASHVNSVLLIGRSSAHITHEKLSECIVESLFELTAIKERLKGFNACIFCVGVSAAFLDEETYTRLTYDLTLSVAKTLLALNPDLTFVYVTGQGTDRSESGSSMWARVKGRTETRC